MNPQRTIRAFGELRPPPRPVHVKESEKSEKILFDLDGFAPNLYGFFLGPSFMEISAVVFL